MDSFDFDNVKAEKAKALNSYKSIGFLFRVTEIVVALLLLCWIFTCLPFFVRISGEFLRRLACFVSTPLFMFVLGNCIVVALFTTKSSVFSAARSLDNETDIYDAFIRSGENRVGSSDVLDLTEETTVFDDKQMIIDDAANSKPTVAREDHVTVEPDEKEAVSAKVYRRSKSEMSAKQSAEMVTKPSLRRSETEKCRENVEKTSCEEVPFPEDNLTNEEFQKTIEAFIAKQLVFRRRESLAVVIHNQI